MNEEKPRSDEGTHDRTLNVSLVMLCPSFPAGSLACRTFHLAFSIRLPCVHRDPGVLQLSPAWHRASTTRTKTRTTYRGRLTALPPSLHVGMRHYPVCKARCRAGNVVLAAQPSYRGERAVRTGSRTHHCPLDPAHCPVEHYRRVHG